MATDVLLYERLYLVHYYYYKNLHTLSLFFLFFTPEGRYITWVKYNGPESKQIAESTSCECINTEIKCV